MLSFRDLPIRNKFLVMILATNAVSLALVMIGIIFYELSTYNDRLIRQMAQMSEFIAANSAPSLAFDDPRTAEEILSTVKALPAVTVAALYTSNGRLYASFSRTDFTAAVLPLVPGPEGERLTGQNVELIRPVVQKGRRLGTLYLNADTVYIYSQLWKYGVIMLVVTMAIGGGAILLQGLLRRQVSTPLLQLSQMAESVAGGNLLARAPVYSGDEIGQLATAFNKMTTELAHSYEGLEQNRARLAETVTHIENSLREKELLLKEIHHRVKNNLQLVSSMIHLQSQYVKDPGTLEFLEDSQRRIRTMALVHERLLRTNNLSTVDLAEYLGNLANDLVSSHVRQANAIRLIPHLAPIKVGIDTAIPLGLIVNELIMNAMKHGLNEAAEGEICLDLTPGNDGVHSLRVADNGKGFPEHIDFRKTESLGLQLVTMLVEGLGGTIELQRNKGKGAGFIMRFEELKYTKRI